MPKVLSVDLGTRNLAWCTLVRQSTNETAWEIPPFRGHSIAICSWRLVDIAEEGRSEEDKAANPSESLNLNDTDIAKIVPWFTNVLKKYTDELTSGVEVAFLEAQPTGRFVPGGKTISNVKTKVLSHILQSFLLDHNVKDVKFVSPAVKLKDAQHFMEDVADYREHKKAARLQTLFVLQKLKDEKCFEESLDWQEWYTTLKGKKDDLADSLLQGLCAALPLNKKTTAKKRKVTAFASSPDPASLEKPSKSKEGKTTAGKKTRAAKKLSTRKPENVLPAPSADDLQFAFLQE
jgi:hypothetical protein